MSKLATMTIKLISQQSQYINNIICKPLYKQVFTTIHKIKLTPNLAPYIQKIIMGETSLKSKQMLSEGQWQGFYQYGPEYGPVIHGKEAEFRLFIEEYIDGQFKGKAIDWDGFGATGEVSTVLGFIEGDLISMTKEYKNNYHFDEWGNTVEDQSKKGHTVVYEGRFHEKTNCFIGTWEISTVILHTNENIFHYLATGTWRMYRHP